MATNNDPKVKTFYDKFYKKYGIYPKEHEVEGYSAIYIIADAMKRAKLTGNLDADRAALREALGKTDMETVFGKVKFANWKGPLGDEYKRVPRGQLAAELVTAVERRFAERRHG